MLLTTQEIESLGFASVGKDVRITRGALFFNPGKISIGDRSRIDAFTIISAGDGGVHIGINVHIAAHCIVNGSGGRVEFHDFSGIAPNVCVWTASDDYTKGSLTNGTIPMSLKQNCTGPVTLGRHVLIGTGSVILPGVQLNDGAAVGALTLIKRNVEAGHVLCGTPARIVAERPLDRLESEAARYLASLGHSASSPES